MLSVLLFVSVVIGLCSAQSSSDCVYRRNGLELNLSPFKGKTLFYNGNDYRTTYTICANSLQCISGSEDRHAMVESNYAGINECHVWGEYNESLQPFYDYAVASWIFNYTAGEPCPDRNVQEDRSVSVAFNCNPLAEEPILVDVTPYDQCSLLLQVEYQGACNPPPPENEECTFQQGFQKLNLSEIKGRILTYRDENNLLWKFSPCANKMNCTTSHGSNVQVMADVLDTQGQCAKFLGVWSGDVFPFFTRNLRTGDHWDFYWADGEECGEGGPLEILNVRYYCNEKKRIPEITKVGGVGPCKFRIEIETDLACPS